MVGRTWCERPHDLLSLGPPARGDEHFGTVELDHAQQISQNGQGDRMPIERKDEIVLLGELRQAIRFPLFTGVRDLLDVSGNPLVAT